MERYFECTWPSEWGEEHSRVSNLSPTGCYIESRSAVPVEATTLSDIMITLPGGAITLQGTVVHAIRGVGFAVEFTDLDQDTHDVLSELVQR